MEERPNTVEALLGRMDALLAPLEAHDDDVVARRAADHALMDQVLVDRVRPEDEHLAKVEEQGDRTRLDRALTPFNRAGTKRFLRESRRKVWFRPTCTFPGPGGREFTELVLKGP